MKSLKFIVSVLLIISFHSEWKANASIHSDSISIKVNNNLMNLEQPPMLIEEKTFVPMRVIFEALGAKIYWDEQNQSVFGVKGTNMIRLTIGSTNASVNGVDVKLEAAPMIVNETTMVPLRFVSEALGATVEWNSEARIVSIVTSSEEEISSDFKSNFNMNEIKNSSKGLGSKYGNMLGNLQQTTFDAVIKDGWLYYWSYGSRLLKKVKLDGTEEIVLRDTYNRVSNLSEVDGWLYFSEGDIGKSIFSKMKLDGSEYTEIAKGISRAVYYNGWFYYYISSFNKTAESAGLFKIKPDGSEKTLISPGPKPQFYIFNDWIYYDSYSQNREIRKMKMDGTEDQQVNGKIDRHTPIFFIDNTIVTREVREFGSGLNLFISHLDGSNKVQITKENVSTYNIIGDWIYYGNFEDGQRLYRMKIDGSENMKMSEFTASKIYVFDEGVLFLSRTRIGDSLPIDGPWYFIDHQGGNLLKLAY